MLSSWTQIKRKRVDLLAALGGLLALIDSLWGGIAALPFDWSQARDAFLGLALMIALPAYALDFWSGRHVVLFLPALFLLRWIATSTVSTPPYWGDPWRGSLLLIVASILLQLSKLQAVRAESSRDIGLI